MLYEIIPTKKTGQDFIHPRHFFPQETTTLNRGPEISIANNSIQQRLAWKCLRQCVANQSFHIRETIFSPMLTRVFGSQSSPTTMSGGERGFLNHQQVVEDLPGVNWGFFCEEDRNILLDKRISFPLPHVLFGQMKKLIPCRIEKSRYNPKSPDV